MRISQLLVCFCAVMTAACSGGADGGAAQSPASQSPPPGDPFDIPLAGLSSSDVEAFFTGDNLFDLPLREGDGLGPLYVRSACGACHEGGVRGPGAVQKMSVVLDDGLTASPDQSALPFGHSVRPLLTAGATTPVEPPEGTHLRLSQRMGLPILGRGYLEAIDDAEILRVAAEQAARTDGIHGRPNHVTYESEPNPDPTFNAHEKGDAVIGRFGVKARIATLDEFTADAFQGDMGITSPLRPVELPNPDGLADDGHPGVDVSAESVNARAFYVRTTAIPWRPDDPAGAALFDSVGCASCHVPSMKTRVDYPIALLAGIDAPVYSDLLLHDMGDALADGMVEGDAGSRDFRTAPLIGLRFDRTYLHDGRAKTIDEAILSHDGEGSEAAATVQRYRALPPSDRDALVAFVRAL